MKTVIVEALLLLVLLAIVAVLFRRRWYDRLCGLSPTTPDTPGDDDREAGDDPEVHEGATEEFAGQMHQLAKEMREERIHLRDLRPIAEEHGLNLDLPADRAWCEELLTFRRSGDELTQHYTDDRLGHLEAWLDDWAPGWRRLRLANVLDETGEYDVRELDAMLAGAA